LEDEVSYLDSIKLMDAELIQYLNPVGWGPSGKRCPKCEPQFEQTVSSLIMPWLRSSTILTLSVEIESKKLGQPDFESNLVSDEKREDLQTTHSYTPTFVQSQYIPVNALSVPPPQQI
jgi:hypothetical protein